MRFLQAEITGFGKYENQSFDFVPGNQLLFGANEAGKSTLYHFFLVVLFGFPKKHAKRKDYTPQNGLAYGGRLRLYQEPYGEIVIERYRQVNKGKAKVWINGQPKEEEILAQVLGPLNRELFQEVFTFQQEQLSQIDKLAEDELHQHLLSLGVSGSQMLVSKEKEYSDTTKQVFKARGHKQPLNQALKKWEELRERIAEKEKEEHQLQESHHEIMSLKERQAAIEKKLDATNQSYQVLQRQISHWGLYEEWQQLKEQPVFAKDVEEEAIKRFDQQYQQLSLDIQQKEEELNRLEQGQESDKYFFFLDQEYQISQILQQQVGMIQLENDYARTQIQQKKHVDQVNQLVAKWRWSKTNPPLVTEGIAEKLSAIHTLEQKESEYNQQLLWLTQKQQELEAELAILEKNNPSLLQKNTPQKNGYWLIAGGIFFGVIGLFLPDVWRIIVGIGAAFLLGVGISGIKKQAPGKKQQIFAKWQEKLLQLDVIVNEGHEARQGAQEHAQIKNQYIAGLQPFFGQREVAEWPQYLTDYQQAIHSYQQMQSELSAIDAQLVELQEKIHSYDDLFAPFLEWLPIAGDSLIGKLQKIQQFATEMQTIKETRLQQPSTLLAQQLKQKRRRRDVLLQEHEKLLQSIGLERPEEVRLWLRQWEKAQQVQARRLELETVLTEIFPTAVSQTEIAQQKEALESEQLQLKNQVKQYSEQRQRLELKVEQQQKDGTLDQLYQEESDRKAEIKELAVNWGSHQLAAAALKDLTTELSDQQLPQLLAKASQYFRILSRGAYQEISFRDKLLLVRNQQQEFSIIDLSTGTKDQLIMAIRLGYLAVSKPQPLCPIIIDDGWLHYDSQRKEQLAKLLVEFGQQYQVICLSSDKEMVSYYQMHQQAVQKISERM